VATPVYLEIFDDMWELRGLAVFAGGWDLPRVPSTAKVDADGRRIVNLKLGKAFRLWLSVKEDGTLRAAAFSGPSEGGSGESGYLSGCIHRVLRCGL
jgi:hypothetical protein